MVTGEVSWNTDFIKCVKVYSEVGLAMSSHLVVTLDEDTAQSLLRSPGTINSLN